MRRRHSRARLKCHPGAVRSGLTRSGLHPAKLRQGRIQVFQSSADHRGIASDANPEVLWHSEKLTGHNRCFVFHSKQLEKAFRIACGQVRKCHASAGRSKTFKLYVYIKKLIEQLPVSG